VAVRRVRAFSRREGHGKAGIGCRSSCAGVIKPGTQVNEIIAHNDWLPTFLAAAGEPNIKEKLLLMRRILDLRVA
jgi:hypothetical protein